MRSKKKAQFFDRSWVEAMTPYMTPPKQNQSQSPQKCVRGEKAVCHELPATDDLIKQLDAAPKGNLVQKRRLKTTSDLTTWGNDFLRSTNFALR